MYVYEGVEVGILLIRNWEIDGGGQLHAPAALYRESVLGSH
jgi:hypothetical protein